MTASDLPHLPFANRIVEVLKSDGRFVGLLAGGSFIDDQLDQYSDLDLVLVVDAANHAQLMATRRELAASFGHLLYSFTGEHVGEPRLLICLYADPLLHVDLKFVTADDLLSRVETPVVLWDRDGEIAERIGQGAAQWPNRRPQWFEDRFWTWIHYTATKLGRGELFETIDALTSIRHLVLGPLIARRAGASQRGARRLEEVSAPMSARLADTVADYSREGCARSLRQTIELYRELRLDIPPPNQNPAAEAIVVAFVERVISRK